jgi:hypothetical protein
MRFRVAVAGEKGKGPRVACGAFHGSERFDERLDSRFQLFAVAFGIIRLHREERNAGRLARVRGLFRQFGSMIPVSTRYGVQN